MAARRRQFVDDRDLSDENEHHRQNTHESAQFLTWCAKLDRDVSPSDLGELWQEWRERQDHGEQAELRQWGER